MSGVYEQYLIRLLDPLGLYDLSGVQNRSELAALGMELDNVSAALDAVERESLLATAEDQGLSRREALFAETDICKNSCIKCVMSTKCVRYGVKVLHFSTL